MLSTHLLVCALCASGAAGARILPAQRPLGPAPARALAFASSRARAAAPRMQGFFDGIKDIALQYADQRVARASHIQLRAGDDSGILLAQWKEEIGDDEEKFAARARESSTCRSAPKGGDLGFLTVRARHTRCAIRHCSCRCYCRCSCRRRRRLLAARRRAILAAARSPRRA